MSESLPPTVNRKILALLVGLFCQTCISHAIARDGEPDSDVISSDTVMFSMQSPSGNIKANLFTDSDGSLTYEVYFKEQQVIEPSQLGISVGGIDLGHVVRIGKPSSHVVKQTYATRGKHPQAVDHSLQWTFPIETGPIETGPIETGKRRHSIQFRLYDDGVAFRYIVPGIGTQHVDGERSSWKVIGGTKVWYFERLNKDWKLKSYAGEWLQTDITDLHRVSPPSTGPAQGTPLVCELPDGHGYVAITKAALSNYSGMRLRPIGNRTVAANFAEGDTGFDVDGEIVTPWRVTLLANDLNDLVNSDLIGNLNPRPDEKLFKDRDYILTGRCVWSWETLGLGTPETQRTFIDLAAEIGFEFSLIDDGWKDWDEPFATVRSLCQHARKNNIGVWLWVHSRDIMDPRNDYSAMQDYFQQVAATGAVGIKIDFMNGESKKLIDFEIAALRIAAQNRLMVNFHGCHASTGESRTWPNEMTREGIRGIEVNKMREGPLTASHNAALPFTRFVVGHADYTPLLYTNPGPTTLAHQLATTIAFDSPLQIYAEHPRTMMQSPAVMSARDVMKEIPTVWDETIVLPGSKIGDLAAFARRSGDTWFVGILNGVGQREYTVSLDFLSESTYAMRAVSDDTSAMPISIASIGVNQKAKRKQWTETQPLKLSTRSKITSNTVLTIPLAKGGGWVGVIK